MSGAFEVAAGAFAVVGVADVILRTGREIYNFLHDVADAPNELKALNESLQETETLVIACQKCWVQNRTHVSTTASIRTPLESGLKALDRELQNLKRHIVKLKGSKKSWQRLQYVLNDHRIGKALNSLEWSKMLLANALMIAYGELSSANSQALEALIRQYSQQLGLKADNLPKVMETLLHTHQQSVSSTLNHHHRKFEHNQGVGQRTLETKLGTISSQHKRSARISTKTYQHIVKLSVKVDAASKVLHGNHEDTRNLISGLVARIDRLEISINDTAPSSEQTCSAGAHVQTWQHHIPDFISKPQPCFFPSIIQNPLWHHIGTLAHDSGWLSRHSQHVQRPHTRQNEHSVSFLSCASTSTESKGKRKSDSLLDECTLHGLQIMYESLPPFSKRLRHGSQYLSFHMPIGTLQLYVLQDKDSRNEKLPLEETSFLVVRIACHSDYDLDPHFSHMRATCTRPIMRAQIRDFIAIPCSQRDLYTSLIRDESVSEMNVAIQEARLSLYRVSLFGNDAIFQKVNSRHDDGEGSVEKKTA